MKNDNKNIVNTENDVEKVVKERIPKFGFLDFLIILLVIVSIVGIYFRFDLVDIISKNTNTKDYSVSFQIKNIKYSTSTYFHSNDSVYIDSSGELLGVIIENPNAVPSTETFVENGEAFEITYPESSRVDVRGKLKCTGTENQNGGLYINSSTQITVGQSLEVRTEKVSFIINITDIQVIAQE